MEAPPQKLIAQANFLVAAEALTERSRPWAFDDSAITEQGNPVSIAILDNDFDPDEDPNFDPAWEHVSCVYEVLTRTIVSP